MTILNILIYPNKNLNKVAKLVKNINLNIKKIISDMIDTMYYNKGIGLSATQVNINKRIIVIDVSESKNNPLILINPIILNKNNNIEIIEGCLSFPNIFLKTKRFNEILIRFTNINNEVNTLEVDNLLSVCIQHEIDHLNGILFIKYASEKDIKKINNIFIKNE
ncbi:peptide deformylase [endosymbiont of Pachyrhynchus infernalis]|uniref:peptide deformylase n=1 Tax=endosymbiont of Pachyrhynchus infernalis TaxID=1971488 RepID=UPI000DC70E69|nr:peptide deformylase [endosymbiont of Pachyrhynchus infernalis]BBA84859.1 peptide deformylase [endosymbiont of Pachyrhynchus infernalis]